MSDDPLELLRRVVQACERATVPYAVIGAVARNAWAPPRATTDIDLALAVDAASYAALIAALAGQDVTVKRTMSADPAAVVPDLALLEGPPGPVRRLDFLIAKTAFEHEAIDRSVEADIGIRCHVVRPEHLIVYKLIAGRPRDFDDAEEVLRTRALAREPVDGALIRRWAVDWSIEDRLEQLLAAVRAP